MQDDGNLIVTDYINIKKCIILMKLLEALQLHLVNHDLFRYFELHELISNPFL